MKWGNILREIFLASFPSAAPVELMLGRHLINSKEIYKCGSISTLSTSDCVLWKSKKNRREKNPKWLEKMMIDLPFGVLVCLQLELKGPFRLALTDHHKNFS